MIFVDTSFWIAQLLPRERHHDAARALTLDHGSAALITSNLVLGETWTFLRRRAGHPRALRWLETVRSLPGLGIVAVSEGEEVEAWEWLARRHERSYSFVDATSFAVMRARRLREALTFDGDFAAAGFVELSPS